MKVAEISCLIMNDTEAQLSAICPLNGYVAESFVFIQLPVVAV
jgi:hypothetical protein